MQRLFVRPQPAPNSEAFLRESANELNKRLPMFVDRDTELVSTLGFDGVFVYKYRLVNVSASELDDPRLLAMLKPNVTEAVCTKPSTHALIARGVVLRYSYADKDRTFVGSFDVAPSACGL